jgi:tetratricopeptide (TPR) repeat protein
MTAKLVCVSVAVLVAGVGAVQQPAHDEDAPPTLPASLGRLHHPIRTTRTEAQLLFDRGLTLHYGFNRDAARRSFAAASRIDPDAAMAQAGIALALGPNLNMESSPAQIQAACDASRTALKLSREDDERRYAGALSARYCDTDGRGRLNPTAYAEAMSALHRDLPQDPDAATLYADSLLELRPRTVRQDAEIVAILEGVMQQHPDHVGANHYYVHAVEGTASPERGLQSAKRLETLVPGVGHLVHMPSHIYMRAGRYETSIALNRRAAAADLAYLRTNPPGHDGAMSYLHDLESLAVAAGFTGRFAEAHLAASEIARVEADLAGEGLDGHFSAPLAMVLLRFHKWSEVEALPAPPESDASSSFLSHFSRAVAFAALGQPGKAQAERDAFSRAAKAIPDDAFYRSNPMSAVRAVFEAVIAARLAATSANAATAAAAWARAVAAQDRLAYHEPPAFYYPTRESLGAALFVAGRQADAERVFREDLARNPSSGRALFGVWQSLQARRPGPEAEPLRRAFVTAWSHSDVRLSLTSY